MGRNKKNMTKQEAAALKKKQEAAKKEKAEYNKEYQKENIIRFTFKLNTSNEIQELLDTWNKIQHKSAFIRSAILTLGEAWLDGYDQTCENGESFIIGTTEE